jgi:hypothetical protein
MINRGSSPAAKSRRADVDFMRAMLVVGIALFHSARIFDLLPFYVKNDRQSLAIMAFVGFVSQWGMPLLFVIAGFAIWHSLEARTARQFVADRLRRLIVPFVFGVIVLVPPQHYYQLRTNPEYHESYWSFYPKFFRIVIDFDFPEFIKADPAVGLFGPGHLWFLYYLFAFSLLLLPLFVYLQRETGRALLARLAHFCERPAAVFLLSVPVLAIETLVMTDESTGWNRFAYMPFIAYGFLFAADSRFEAALYRHRLVALALGSACIVGFFAVTVHIYQGGIDPTRGFGAANVSWRVLKSLSSFFWIVAILGFVHGFNVRSRKKEDTTPAQSGHAAASDDASDRAERVAVNAGSVSGTRRYANEAVMPFYILHQTVIVIVGFYVVKLNAGVAIKYLMVVAATLVITLSLYEAVIKRTIVTRFLFGMRLRSAR